MLQLLVRVLVDKILRYQHAGDGDVGHGDGDHMQDICFVSTEDGEELQHYLGMNILDIVAKLSPLVFALVI